MRRSHAVSLLAHILRRDTKPLQRLGKHFPTVIRNQLSRADLSIPLNIAEGNGRWH
ncbi:MAG: four helix bundle protein [Proteobacteria bacterium]|nr:MAG: four helix bundle protein [Pseudomonadota bacterium]